MSNLIYACWREPEDALDEASLNQVADRIAPSGSRRHPHHVVVAQGDSLCLTGPIGALFPGHFRESLVAAIRKTPSLLAPNRSLRAALKRIIPTSWVRRVRAQM